MTWPGKYPRKEPRSKLAAAYGLPEESPDNVVRMYAGALSANNQAHEIKDGFDTNNPPQPPALTEKVTAS
jgi:hypothetical protein